MSDELGQEYIVPGAPHAPGTVVIPKTTTARGSR